MSIIPLAGAANALQLLIAQGMSPAMTMVMLVFLIGFFLWIVWELCH